MRNTEFQRDVFDWLATGAASLIDTLPKGSGIYRLVPVEPTAYSFAYLSTQAGSFKKLGDSGNWYSQNFTISAAEKRSPGSAIYELSRLSQDTPVANMWRLPQTFLDAIYQDKDLPRLLKFDKSHIVVDGLAKFLPSGTVSGCYFPSRRESGGCLVINPSGVSIGVLYTGSTPPEQSVFDRLRY